MRKRTAVVLSIVGLPTTVLATGLDFFDPPPAGDPSQWTGPIVSETLADALTDQPPVYKGA